MFACGSPQIDLKSNMPHINFQDTYNTGFVFRFESHKKNYLELSQEVKLMNTV